MDPIKLAAPTLSAERGSTYEIQQLREKVSRLENLQAETASALHDLARNYADLVRRLRAGNLI